MIIRIDMLFHPTSFLEYPASKIIEQSSRKLDPALSKPPSSFPEDPAFTRHSSLDPALSKPPSSFQDHRAIFREA